MDEMMRAGYFHVGESFYLKKEMQSLLSIKAVN